MIVIVIGFGIWWTFAFAFAFLFFFFFELLVSCFHLFLTTLTTNFLEYLCLLAWLSD